jgi:hypothetical protein
MFDCRIYLCVFSYSTQPGNIFVVSSAKEKYIPLIVEIDNNLSIKDCILNTLDSYIDNNILNTFIQLIDIEKIDNNINIYYACRLPIGSKLTHGYNISYQYVSAEPIIRKCLYYV